MEGKAVLSRKDVQKDLNTRAVLGAFAYMLGALPLVIFSVFVLITGVVRAIVYGIMLLAIAAFLIVRWIKCIMYLLRSRGGPVVVIGKRIDAPKASPFPVHDKYSEQKFLYFESYGWFPSPDMDCPDMNRAYSCATNIWWSSQVGDSFYLVLDGDGYVVHIYPCDKYEYTGPLTRHVIKNGRIRRQ